MGRVFCGKHNALACWNCDACPVCDGVRIGKGDYCQGCIAKAKAAGLVWSPYHQNFMKPGDARQSTLGFQ
jgi:hypothetical protein